MKRPAGVPPELLTIRDWLRYAVSRFNAANLSYGHGTTRALDDAAFLILATLELPVDDLDPWLEAKLTANEKALLHARIEARVNTRKPTAYLVGHTYIGGHRFKVDERAIIPRSFIGELLVGEPAVLHPSGGFEVATVLDLCTGGGSLAILAADAFPDSTVDAVEIAADTLALAKENVAEHGLDGRIKLFKGDLFTPLKGRRYDLILSNPPYVNAAGMAALTPEFLHEPKLALAGGKDGLDLVRRIIDGAGKRLTENGALVVEIGTGRSALEAAYPKLEFLWLDTAESEGEVFQLLAADLKR